MNRTYVARVCRHGGRPIYRSPEFPTHEAAAIAAFKDMPDAGECSVGRSKGGKELHFDLRTFRREELV